MTYLFSGPLVIISFIGYLQAKGTAGKVPKELYWFLICRCLAGLASDLALFTAFHYIEYSKAFVVGKLETVIAPIISCFTLDEKLKYSDVFTLILVICGVILILQPSKRFDDINKFNSETTGIIWALVASFCGAWMFFFCRKLGNQVHHSVGLLYYFTLSSLLTPVLALVQAKSFSGLIPEMRIELANYIGGIVLVFYLHMEMMDASLKHNTVGLMTVLFFLSIPFCYLLEWLTIQRPISENEQLGVGLIFISNVGMATLRLFKFIN